MATPEHELEDLPTLEQRQAARLAERAEADRARKVGARRGGVASAKVRQSRLRHGLPENPGRPSRRYDGDMDDTKSNELPTGFSKGGVDLRGSFPDVLELKTRIVEVVRSGSLPGMSPTMWSLALRLAANEIDELRKKGKVAL